LEKRGIRTQDLAGPKVFPAIFTLNLRGVMGVSILQPLEVRFRPMEVRFRPMEVRFRPMEVRFRPMEVRFRPMEVRFRPMEVRT
jgi:hypothetical protein